MSAALPNPERYSGGERPELGDVVEDTSGLFVGRRRVLHLGRQPGRTNADLVVVVSEGEGPRTPVTLRLVERS